MNAEKLQLYIFNLLPSPSPYPTPIKIGYLPIFFWKWFKKENASYKWHAFLQETLELK